MKKIILILVLLLVTVPVWAKDASELLGHADDHATGGSDAIAPGDIGAEPAYAYGTLSGTQSLSIADLTAHTWNNYPQTAAATYSFGTTGQTGLERAVFKFGTTSSVTFDPVADNLYLNGTAVATTVTGTPTIGSQAVLTSMQTGASTWIWLLNCPADLFTAN